MTKDQLITLLNSIHGDHNLQETVNSKSNMSSDERDRLRQTQNDIETIRRVLLDLVNK